jgi:hypothetical protein
MHPPRRGGSWRDAAINRPTAGTAASGTAWPIESCWHARKKPHCIDHNRETRFAGLFTALSVHGTASPDRSSLAGRIITCLIPCFAAPCAPRALHGAGVGGPLCCRTDATEVTEVLPRASHRRLVSSSGTLNRSRPSVPASHSWRKIARPTSALLMAGAIRLRQP